MAVVAAVTFAAGFYPAVVLARVPPASAIAAGVAAGVVPLGSKLFSTILVGTQFAVASALLLFVSVLALQNAALARSGLGVTEDPLVVIDNPTRITKVEQATLRAELERLPQVKGVTEVLGVPWEMTMITELSDSPDPSSAERPVLARSVGEDFFEVFGIELLAGRALGEHADDWPAAARAPAPAASGTDNGPAPNEPRSGAGDRGTAGSAGGSSASGSGTPAGGTAPPANQAPLRQRNIVVDRAFVEYFGLGTPEQAVGKLMYALPGRNSPVQQAWPHHIVGVVENRAFSLFGFQGANASYYSLNVNMGNTVARIDRRDVAGALAAIDARWRELAPNVPNNRRFLDDSFNRSFETYLRMNRLFSLLALMAFAISTAGLFGMSTLVAARRRREVGVRKTFGATTPQMIRMLLASFSKPVVIANVIVWPLVFVGARAYVNQFLEPIAITPLPFVASLLATLAIAWLAVGGQTLRTARRKPAEVLRDE